MGYALPPGVLNTDTLYLFASGTLSYMGEVTKGVNDQTLVAVDYSQVTAPFFPYEVSFSVDVSTNPALTITFPTTFGYVLKFLVSGGIAGQQYVIGVNIISPTARTDVIYIDIPSSSGDCCDVINPVAPIYNQLPLGGAAYVNAGIRLTWGPTPPTSVNTLDQWYNTTNNTLYEYVTAGTTSEWKPISVPVGFQMPEAPANGVLYSRQAPNWVPTPIQSDAPQTGMLYVRTNNFWIPFPTDMINSTYTPNNVFDSLASIQLSNIDAPVNNIVSLSFLTPGDLRGYTMQFARTDSLQTGGVQSGDGTYWALTNNVVIPQMFGALAIGDAAHDDYPAIQAALDFVYANGGRVHFPAGNYYSSQTLNVIINPENTNAHLTGDGMGLYLIFSCVINFPMGVTGISINTAYGGGGGHGSFGAIIEGLDLSGVIDPTGGSSTAHGVTSITNCCLRRINCAAFGGNGFNLPGYNFPGTQPGSTDLARVDECNAWGNQGNGFFHVGQDANVITYTKCSAGSNGQYGFRDDSFLGVTYLSCHSASNGFGGGITGVLGANVNYGGIVYGVVPVYEQFAYPLPGSTTPGTDQTVWFPISTTTDADTWVRGGSYMPGGPYCNTNLNARTVWVGCYAEGTSNMFYIGSNSVMILGGLQAASIVGQNYSTSAGGNSMYGGIVSNINPLAGQPGDEFLTVSIGAPDVSGKQTIMQVSSYNPTTSYNGFLLRLAPEYGDLTYNYSYYSSDYSFIVTGNATQATFGSGAAQPQTFGAPRMGLGDAATGIVIQTGAAPFGAAGKGWIVYNSNPVPGGNVGWVCTTGGASPVWNTFGTIGT